MNSLPDLPKQNKHREADFGLWFRQWVDNNYDSLPDKCSLELKDSRGKDSIPFAEITDDQLDYGLAVKSRRGKLTRIEKGTVGASDYNFMKNAYAYVVIKYPSGVFMIEIGALIAEKARSERKSLTSERARMIAERVLD